MIEKFLTQVVRTDRAYKNYRQRWFDNPKNKVVDTFPIGLTIELIGEQGVSMSEELYDIIIQECKRYGLCSVAYAGRGNLFHHPQLGEFVAAAKKMGAVEVSLGTIGEGLNTLIIQQLIDAKLDVIHIYVQHKKQPLFDNLLFLRKQRYNHLPQVVIRMLCNTHDWDSVADQLETATMVDSTNHSPDMRTIKPDCPTPYRELFVLSDGDVVPCPYALSYVVGNIYKDTLHDIWLGEKMTKLRTLTSNEAGVCLRCALRRMQA